MAVPNPTQDRHGVSINTELACRFPPATRAEQSFCTIVGFSAGRSRRRTPAALAVGVHPFEGRRSPTGSSGHKLGKVCAEALQITQRIKSEAGAMRGLHNSSFDPQTLLLLETAFDEAWLTLKFVGNKTVKPDELARSVLRVAMEGERDPIRLQDGALERLLPATTWREAS